MPQRARSFLKESKCETYILLWFGWCGLVTVLLLQSLSSSCPIFASCFLIEALMEVVAIMSLRIFSPVNHYV